MNQIQSIKSILSTLTVVVLLHLAIGPPVFAGSRDAKEYPGIVCAVDADSALKYLGFALLNGINYGTSTLYANCPLLRDKMSSNDGIETVKVYVRNNGSGPLPWMWCRLIVRKPSNHFTGYTTYYSGYDFQPTTDSTGTWFEITPRKKFPSQAYYSARCRLPSEVAIESISMTEKGY